MSTELKPFRSMHGEMAVTEIVAGPAGMSLLLTQTRMMGATGAARQPETGCIQLSRNDAARLRRRLRLWLERTKPKEGPKAL